MAARRSRGNRGGRAERERRERAATRRAERAESNLRIVGGRQKRIRRRHRKPDADRKTEIVRRVIDNFDREISARTDSADDRRQRYAKYRGWLAQDIDFPWPGASNVDIPDMRTACFDVQDSLHNAVLSGRPAVVAEALSSVDEGKTETLDALLDYQVFQEQNGEGWVGDAAEHFTTEGHVTLFTPWVREKAMISVQASFPPVPPDVAPANYFNQIVVQSFPKENEVWAHPTDESKRSWRLATRADHSDEYTIEFYDTLKDGVEGVEYYGQREELVYDGPSTRVIPWEQVVYPAGVANLQPQTAANHKGALWVALVDYPTKAEIAKLQRNGTYDLLSADERDALLGRGGSRELRQTEDQEHTMQGTFATAPKDKIDQELTRLMVFDHHDIDNDGKPEGMIYTVLKEPQLLVRAEPLTERYRVPTGGRPWRPLAEAAFLPSRGRREGMGLPDLMEGLHDMMKESFDTAFDTDKIQTVITGAYNPAAGMPLETLSLSHGDLIPLDNPRDDLVFRPVPTSSGAFAFNAISLLTKWEEEMTTLGALQRGRVPAGKATALRTSSGIQTILEQGEARPERTLRRFFGALVQVYQQMHWLNLMHLPGEKQIRVAGIREPGETPYMQVSKHQIQGVFQFSFGANASNASRSAKADLLLNLLTTAINPLLMQMGISNADTIYRLVRDWTNAIGAEPERYWAEPTPTADLDPISAEEVLMGLIQDPIVTPVGSPQEGAREHLEKIGRLIDEPMIELEGGGKGSFMQIASPEAATILGSYIRSLESRIAQQAQQEQLAQAAQGGAPQLPAGGARAASPVDTSQAPLQGSELQDETLPGNNRPQEL